MSIGNFPESLSQAMLVWVMLVGRLGVWPRNQNMSSPMALIVYRRPCSSPSEQA